MKRQKFKTIFGISIFNTDENKWDVMHYYESKEECEKDMKEYQERFPNCKYSMTMETLYLADK